MYGHVHVHGYLPELHVNTCTSAGGPHFDANGQPDPRTIDSLEVALIDNGGKPIGFGLYKFEDHQDIHTVRLGSKMSGIQAGSSTMPTPGHA